MCGCCRSPAVQHIQALLLKLEGIAKEILICTLRFLGAPFWLCCRGRYVTSLSFVHSNRLRPLAPNSAFAVERPVAPPAQIELEILDLSALQQSALRASINGYDRAGVGQIRLSPDDCHGGVALRT